jgi:hypothetical protein
MRKNFHAGEKKFPCGQKFISMRMEIYAHAHRNLALVATPRYAVQYATEVRVSIVRGIYIIVCDNKTVKVSVR